MLNSDAERQFLTAPNCITLLSSMYFWAMILYFPVEPFYSLFATVSSCQKVGTAKSTRAQLAPAYTNLSRQSWLPFLSFRSFIFCLDASLKSSHQYFWLNAGIRACGDLPPWSPPHRRSSRSWRLLYHPLRRRLWEDWHEDHDLWDPSSRGAHFIIYLPKLQIVFVWRENFIWPMRFLLRRWMFAIENIIWSNCKMYLSKEKILFYLWDPSSRVDILQLEPFNHQFRCRSWPRTVWRCLSMRSCTTRWLRGRKTHLLIEQETRT